jgi:hypothetical protein
LRHFLRMVSSPGGRTTIPSKPRVCCPVHSRSERGHTASFGGRTTRTV